MKKIIEWIKKLIGKIFKREIVKNFLADAGDTLQVISHAKIEFPINAILKRKKHGNYFDFYWWDKRNKKNIGDLQI